MYSMTAVRHASTWPILTPRSQRVADASVIRRRSSGKDRLSFLPDLQPEARQLALLQLVVDDKPDADSQGDQARSGHHEDVSLLQDPRQQQATEDQPDAARNQRNRGPARIAK